MKITKFLSVFLVLVMLCSTVLSSCGQTPEETTTVITTEADETTAATETNEKVTTSVETTEEQSSSVTEQKTDAVTTEKVTEAETTEETSSEETTAEDTTATETVTETVTEEETVVITDVMIGDNHYDSFEDAYEAAVAGDKITLKKDIDGFFIIDKEISVDRNVYDEKGNIIGLYDFNYTSDTLVPTDTDGIIEVKGATSAYIVVTLGTDWGVSYLEREDFKYCYSKLINALKCASPDTKIILQSINFQLHLQQLI